MKVLGIIPARIGSTRLPRKPLIDLLGKSLIQRTYESCQKSLLLSDIVVATDSEEIQQHVISFNGKVVLTQEHSSGTSRMLEVIKMYPEYDLYLNIQGDNPNVRIEHIDSLIIKLMDLDGSIPNIATPIVKFQELDELDNKNVVKVVHDKYGKALYFSRSQIPFNRSCSLEDMIIKYGKKHLGLYGFNKPAIEKIEHLQSSDLEMVESLEQLSWLYYQIPIYCVEVEHDIISIDTASDVEKFRRVLNDSKG